MQGLVQSRLPSWQDPPARSRRRSNGEMAAAALFLRLDRSCSGFIYESQIRPIWAALANYVQEGNASMFLRQLRERTAPISRAEWTSIMEALQSIVGDRLFRTLMRGAETLLAELECAALEFRCRSDQLDALEWQPGSGSQKVRAWSKPSELGRQMGKEAADTPQSQRVAEVASVQASVAEAAPEAAAPEKAAAAAAAEKASAVTEAVSASAEGATTPAEAEACGEKKAAASEVGAVSAEERASEVKPWQTPARDSVPITHDQSVSSSSSAGHVQQPSSGKGQSSTRSSAQEVQPQPQSQLPVPRPKPSNTGPKQVRKPKAEPKAAPGRRDIGINTDPVNEGRLGGNGASSVPSNTGPKQSRKGRGELTKELVKANPSSRTASNSRNASKSEADQPLVDAKTSADAAPPPREAAPPPERATAPAKQGLPAQSKQQPLAPAPPPQLRAPRPPDASSMLSSSRPAGLESRAWSRSMSEPGPGGFKQNALTERLPSLLPVSGAKSSNAEAASSDSKRPLADAKRLSASKRPSGDAKRQSGDIKRLSGDVNRLSSGSKSPSGDTNVPAGETTRPSEKTVESTLALSKTADSASSYKELRARLDGERKELHKQRQQVRDLERLLNDASRKEKPHFGITNNVAYRTPVVPEPQVRHPVRKLMVLQHPEKDSSIAPANASKELEPLETERLQLAAHEDKKAVAASRREQSRLRTQAIMHMSADGHDTWELRKMEKASKLEDLSTFSEAMWGSFFEWKADLETDVA